MELPSSPFQKKSAETVFQREKSIFEKSWERIHVYTADLFLAFIPSDEIKQMPPYYMYLFGGTLIVALMAIFIGLFVNGYQSSARQKFLSPLINSVNPSSYCDTIAVANSGLFRASKDGIWEGQDNFDFSAAMYAIQVTNFEIDYSGYQLIMSSVYDSLNNIGQVAVNATLDINMLFWLTYSYLGGGNTAQRFQLLGNPLVVFSRQQYFGSFGNINGTCNVTRSSSFDVSSGMLTSIFRATDYMNSATCTENGPLSYFDYLSGANSDSFFVGMDVRTIVTCVAVNSGLLSIEALVEIKVFGSYEPYAGINFYSSTYYLPKYPSMKPMICISNSTYNLVMCTVHLTPNLFVIPIFNHLGNSTEFPQPCECSKVTNGEKANPYFACNLFRFLAGFIYFSAEFPTNLEYLVNLSLKYQFNLYKLNRDAFNASFISSYFGQNSPYSATFATPEYRESAFDFCSINGTTCKIMVTTVFDVAQYNWAITEYYFQLSMGACQNTFTIPPDKWARLVQTPYAPLVQSYQSCESSESVIWLTQLGVQVGNVSAMTPLCVILMLLMIGLYQRLFGVDIPMGYTKKEKEEALDAFAISLLLARDRRIAEEENERRRIKKKHIKKNDSTDVENNMQDSNLSSRRDDTSHSMISDASSKSQPTVDGIDSGQLYKTAAFSQHQENLLRQLIISLEQDAAYHRDVYRLRQELLSQQNGRKKQRKKPQHSNDRDDCWVNWQVLGTFIRRRLHLQNRGHDSNADVATDDGFSEAGSTSESVSRSEIINPMQSASISRDPSRNDSVSSERGNQNSIQLVSLERREYVASPLTLSRLVTGEVRILNDQRQTNTQNHLSEVPINSTLSLLVKRFEVLTLKMEDSSGGEVEQQYWTLLREVNNTVSSISLSRQAMSLLDIESGSNKRNGNLGVQEKSQLRSLVWPLSRLLAIHGLCMSNVPMSQLETLLGETEIERSETQRQYVSGWAYRLRGEVVVTLGELLQLREQSTEDSDDDDEDEVM